MTPTAWDQGTKNALTCSVAFLASWSIIAAAISLTFDQPALASAGIAFAVLWGVVLLLFVGTWLYGRSTRGRVLLDCGPHPTRSLFLMAAVLFLLVGLTGGLAAAPASTGFAAAGTVFGIASAAYWLILATGRLQVRENGLWQYWTLLR